MALTQVDQGLLGQYAQYTGFKNRIINGAMVIDQRNAGASKTINTDPVYTLDRWAAGVGSNVNNFTVQQSTTVPNSGFANSALVTMGTGVTVSSSGYAYLYQAIEGYNIADLNLGSASASQFTVSFWVRSSVTGTFGVSLRNGASTATYCATYTISSANTWEQKSVTIPAITSGTWYTDNRAGVGLFFDLGVGSGYSGTANQLNTGANYFGVTGTTKLAATTGATFYITGVQLEKGSTATSFDYRPYGTELALCQRYFEMSYEYGTVPGTATGAGRAAAFINALNASSSNFGSTIPFKVTKRSSPSVSLWNQAGTANQWTYCIGSSSGAYYGATINASSSYGFEIGTASPNPTGLLTAGQVYLVAGQWTASAEL